MSLHIEAKEHLREVTRKALTKIDSGRDYVRVTYAVAQEILEELSLQPNPKNYTMKVLGGGVYIQKGAKIKKESAS